MTDTDYLDRLAARTQEWRDKWPSRAAALRQFARRQLGQPSMIDSPFADRVASDWECQVLCAEWRGTMSASKYPSPPEGAHICGGSWDKMPEASRAEIWEFSEYLRTGGKRVHGSYAEWRRGSNSGESA